MSKYSVEEVRAMANNPALLERERNALIAYAERIEADESAAPVAWISHFHIVGLPEKDYYGNLPIQSLQPGVYSHTPLFTHPPAQAAQVDGKVVVIRDGKSTIEGVVLAAAIYMGAVKDIFKLRSDGPPYNEREVTKNTDALRAFDHLDAATKALRSAISHFESPTAEPVAQGEPNIPTVIDDLTFRLIEAIEERDSLRAALAAQPRAVPDGWVLVPRITTIDMQEEGDREIAFGNDCDDVWKAMLDAAPSPGESS